MFLHTNQVASLVTQSILTFYLWNLFCCRNFFIIFFLIFNGVYSGYLQDIPALVAEASKEHSGVSYVITAPLGLHELLVVLS